MPTSNINTYKAILKEAQEGGYLDSIPESEEDIESEALFYIKEADKAYEDGKLKKDKTVIAIRNLAKTLAEEEIEDIFGAPLRDKFKGLPIPDDPEFEAYHLPRDFTEIGDKQLRKLHGEHHAYLARALWMLGVATNQLADATHLRDKEYRKLYKKWASELEKPTRDLVDSYVKEDAEYEAKDALVRKHQEDVVSYKALVEVYKGNVDRLSREWTMRMDEEKRY